ncbi:hypothetical protein M7I_0770 [Glarea lozoyensis 74030]|uniref:Uncharacterized protein n=1 Tax=Glarea lozoyensis (strain ATCC 74030 / MF5533) TaxID=1104152 RepID=H0EE96_GLAL7|nr:hypothetical protein M7I_0770 [Glarea lozoyensis 74030]
MADEKCFERLKLTGNRIPKEVQQLGAKSIPAIVQNISIKRESQGYL